MSKHLKILLGGSPCTHWSIAQSKDRETTASGIGWELFKNYLYARDKFKPDYFLYENNKSAAQPIKDQISQELGVNLQYINSALVSAQNRQRFYAHNIPGVPQPQDRGILLRDVLDSGVAWNEKSYSLTTRCNGAIPEDTLEKKRHTMVAEPIRIGTIEHDGGYQHDSKQYRVYSPDGKATTLCGQGGGVGAKTGLHACPLEIPYNGKTYPVYEVKNGLIEIKGKTYPIKLNDGYYIIRKLTVNECRRLQTIPDWYKMPCSASQNYKMLGNGWTIEVIKHILSHIPNIQNCTVEVLSMYDGMSCGQIALTELGCKIERYVSYEIDKYCIQTTQMNFPKTEQRGDAFQLRNTNWSF
jgi:site-specific DNA-cytosine methylase